MDILITGCERSGTKMLAGIIAKRKARCAAMENKHTIASFRYWQELRKWKKYNDGIAPTIHTTAVEKHSLTPDVNIEFLKWCKRVWPEVEIHYIVRDGLDVVASMVNREWGHTQTGGVRKMTVETAASRWATVVASTYDWAMENATVHRYEELVEPGTQRREALPKHHVDAAMPIIRPVLKMTGYL